VLSKLGRKAFDCVITSPPYNLGGDFHFCARGKKRKSYGAYDEHGDALPETAYRAEQIRVLGALHEVCTDDSWLFYSHKIRIRDGGVSDPVEWLRVSPWHLYQVVVTYTTGATANVDRRRCFPVTERVYILSHEKDMKLENDAGLTDLWRLKRQLRRKVGHPAPFPFGLVENCTAVFPGMPKFVLDPYAGIGTTIWTCARLGIPAWGIEQSAAYCKRARDMLADVLRSGYQTTF